MNESSHLRSLFIFINWILSIIIDYWLFLRKLDCEYQILLSREVGGEDMLEQPLGRSRLSENLIVTNNSMKYWHRHKGPRDWVLSLKCYCFGDDTSSSADLYQLPKIKKISKYLQISVSKYWPNISFKILSRECISFELQFCLHLKIILRIPPWKF